MAMNKVNEVTLTGIITEQKISETFTKQAISFDSKDKDGTWKQGSLESYIKPEILTNSGAQVGDTVRAKGFIVFNFWNDKSFPKFIVNEIQEVEKAQAGAQAYAQPAQPQGYAQTAPQPGAAPTAPGAYAQPAPGAPVAPQAPAMPVPGQVPGMPA